MISSTSPYDFMTVKHHLIDGIYTKECNLPVGIRFDQHKHKFSHMSVLAEGKAIVEVDGVSRTYSAPAILKIEADKVHSVTAIEPVVWLCIHYVGDEFDGDFDTIDMEFIKE